MIIPPTKWSPGRRPRATARARARAGVGAGLTLPTGLGGITAFNRAQIQPGRVTDYHEHVGEGSVEQLSAPSSAPPAAPQHFSPGDATGTCS